MSDLEYRFAHHLLEMKKDGFSSLCTMFAEITCVNCPVTEYCNNDEKKLKWANDVMREHKLKKIMEIFE